MQSATGSPCSAALRAKFSAAGAVAVHTGSLVNRDCKTTCHQLPVPPGAASLGETDLGETPPLRAVHTQPNGFGHTAAFVHHLIELLKVHRLISIAKRHFRIGVDFHN